eukprot:206596-Amphidinium_carterae.1
MLYLIWASSPSHKTGRLEAGRSLFGIRSTNRIELRGCEQVPRAEVKQSDPQGTSPPNFSLSLFPLSSSVARYAAQVSQGMTLYGSKALLFPCSLHLRVRGVLAASDEVLQHF